MGLPNRKLSNGGSSVHWLYIICVTCIAYSNPVSGKGTMANLNEENDVLFELASRLSNSQVKTCVE